jgi:hypothetical protein
MDAHHVVRCSLAEGGRDERSEVAALRSVAVVDQAAHELGPCGRDPLGVPAGPLGARIGEADLTSACRVLDRLLAAMQEE